MSIRRLTLIVVCAASVVSCSTADEGPPAAAAAPPAPATFASQDEELAYLRAENAKLRGQNRTVVKENAVMRDRTSIIEANTKAIESGKLEPGMSVHEANKAVNGSANLYSATCQLVSETDGEWTYRILTGAQSGGPGSGGVAVSGTNMRGDRPTPVQAWLCTFDSHTGKLVRFKRELQH